MSRISYISIWIFFFALKIQSRYHLWNYTTKSFHFFSKCSLITNKYETSSLKTYRQTLLLLLKTLYMIFEMRDVFRYTYYSLIYKKYNKLNGWVQERNISIWRYRLQLSTKLSKFKSWKKRQKKKNLVQTVGCVEAVLIKKLYFCNIQRVKKTNQYKDRGGDGGGDRKRENKSVEWPTALTKIGHCLYQCSIYLETVNCPRVFDIQHLTNSCELKLITFIHPQIQEILLY